MFYWCTQKDNPSTFDDGRNGGGYALPKNSTIELLVSLSETINFIDFCLKGLEHNLLERSNIYFETMINMFQKTPVELPKPPSHKGKRQ